MILTIALVCVGVLVAAASVIVALGWVVAKRVVFPQRQPEAEVIGVGTHSIRLARTPLSSLPGPMGILYNEERTHARMGAITAADPSNRWVERELIHASPGLAEAKTVRVTGDVFGTPAHTGAVATDVVIHVDAGLAPAWELRVAGSQVPDVWAIHVHGAMSGREAVLRSVHTTNQLGFTSLVPSYRGDPDNPQGPEIGSALGQTEWPDIEAAVSYAKNHGARRILLVGWSLGATLALSCVARSHAGGAVDGLVLIAPILNWKSSIKENVRNARLPATVAAAATQLLSVPVTSRWLGTPEPIRFADLAFESTATLDTPTLIVHSTRDRVAPYRDAQTLARRLPSLVTLEAFDSDAHALEWNIDPARFSDVLASWSLEHGFAS